MPFDPWDVKQIEAQAPDDKSIPAARQVLKKGGFERIESRADGSGWWAVCHGLTDTYTVTATRGPTGTIQSGCTCPSPKLPCKHALALLLHLAAHPELRPELKAAEAAKTDHLEGLLAAVFAAPDDDLPRLVLADYLEENGEADRAALIRVSCELEQKKVPAARKKVLTAELARLLSAALADPFSSLPDGTTYQVRRGFVWLTVPCYGLSNPGGMPASLLRLFQDGWVETLVVFNGWYESALPVVRLVRRLDLTGCRMSIEETAGVAAERRHPAENSRLREVVPPSDWAEEYAKLEAGEAGSEGGAAVHLLQSPTAARVRAIAAEGRFRGVTSFTVVGGGDDALAALADVPDLKTLTNLHLQDTAVTAFGLTAVGNSKRLRKVNFLRIEGGPLTDADVQAVAQEAAFPALTQLVLWRLHLTDAALDTITRGPGFARLESLALSDVPVTAAGLRRVAVESPALARLDAGRLLPVQEVLSTLLARTDRPLFLVNDGITAVWDLADGGVLRIGGREELPAGFFAAVAKWPAKLTVAHLWIDHVTFADGALAEVFDFVGVGRIPRVTISHCGLRNADAVALAERLPGSGVTHLDLSENKIGMTGAKALALSPGLAGVVELNLEDNPLLKSGRAALAASPYKGSLEAVNLGGEQVEKAEASELRKAFGKGVKVTLRT
jgi:uncharacterized protein (TIGR02996 family)